MSSTGTTPSSAGTVAAPAPDGLRPRRPRLRRRFAWPLRVLAFLALALVLVLLLLLVVIPRVFGWVPLTVLSGSMEPAIPAASQVVVERVEGEEGVATLAVGDVIVFLPRPDDDTLVMHRVERLEDTPTGLRVTTRGDANDVADPEQVGAREIRGVVQYHVPWVGHVAHLLAPGQRQVAVVLLAGGLLLYAAWQVIAVWRARR